MVLVALADDNGHALWDLEEKTGIAKGNLKLKIDSLVKKGAIYKGAARKTTNKSTSHPNDTEQPYYIVPQRFFIIREELSSSINDTQSKLRRKHEMNLVSSDIEEIKRLRSKLDLYEKLQSEFEPLLATLRIKSPLDRIAGKVDLESLGNSGYEPGAMEQWSPAQAEIYKIAEEIGDYCLTPESAVCAVLVARPDLYAAHDKWIKEHMPSGMTM
jgi:hypothetical protein